MADAPHEYPKWPKVSWYFSQWRDSGNWPRLHDTLRAQVRQQEASQAPTAAASTAKASRRPNSRRTRSDKGKTSKGATPSVGGDAGFLLAVVVTAASALTLLSPSPLRTGSAVPKSAAAAWVDGALGAARGMGEPP